MANIRDVEGDPSSAWDDLNWTEINSAEQKLWMVLGWDEDSWQEDTDPPESDDKYWEDLSTSEKKAAKELGYTQALWDEE
jgi:hypothetical protein